MFQYFTLQRTIFVLPAFYSLVGIDVYIPKVTSIIDHKNGNQRSHVFFYVFYTGIERRFLSRLQRTLWVLGKLDCKVYLALNQHLYLGLKEKHHMVINLSVDLIRLQKKVLFSL
jgi:hypothetical protein